MHLDFSTMRTWIAVAAGPFTKKCNNHRMAPLRMPFESTPQSKGWKKTNYWNQVEWIEYQPFYLDFKAFSPLQEALLYFTNIVKRRLIEEAIRAVVHFLELVSQGADDWNLSISAPSAFFMKINLRFTVCPRVSYLNSKKELNLSLDDFDAFESCLTSLFSFFLRNHFERRL